MIITATERRRERQVASSESSVHKAENKRLKCQWFGTDDNDRARSLKLGRVIERDLSPATNKTSSKKKKKRAEKREKSIGEEQIKKC